MHSIIFVLTVCVLAASGRYQYQGRIINGDDATQGQFPFQVAIFKASGRGVLELCTGAIISEEWILTAAHCITEADTIQVIAGIVDLSDEDRVALESSDYVVHEEFDSLTLRNDIGLVRLDPLLIFSDDIKAIALAEEELDAGVEAIISGWGDSNLDDETDISTTLKFATVTTIDNSDCQQVYGEDWIISSMVCTEAGDPIKVPCFGDAGVPLITDFDTEPVHAGLFSFVSGQGCGAGLPAGYTRTSSYRDWIRNVTGV